MVICVGGLLTKGLPVEAQKQEFSLYAGAGLSGLQYTVDNGAASMKPGFQAGIGYTRWLSPHWGILSGLELGYYHTRMSLNPNTAFSSNQVDDAGDAFEYQVHVRGYQEHQRLYTINIPIEALYQTGIGRHTQWYFIGGVKLGAPMTSSYKVSADQISAYGYYPDLNVLITDLPQHGFGTQTGWTGNGKYELKPSVSLSAETGFRFHTESAHPLYLGLYLDHGLNNLTKQPGTAALQTYDPSSLAQSQATGILRIAGATGDVHLVAYGIRLRWAFGGQKARAIHIKPMTESMPGKPTPEPASAETSGTEGKSMAVVSPDVPAKSPVTDSAAPAIAREKAASASSADTLRGDELALLKKPVPFGRVGDTVLSAATRRQLEQVVMILQTHRGLLIEVQGHTCDIGTEPANDRIGLARAHVVAEYLRTRGVEAGRIRVVSKGDSVPVAPNDSEANRRLNRRVVFLVLDGRD